MANYTKGMNSFGSNSTKSMNAFGNSRTGFACKTTESADDSERVTAKLEEITDMTEADTDIPEEDNTKVQHKHKESLFSKLYSQKDALLDLYKTLHPEEENSNNVTEDAIEIVTLESFLLAKRYNDIAFKVKDRLMILVEHQSTINENMPLRMLLYVAGEYEKVLKGIEKAIYKQNLIKIPAPEFYVVYTGSRKWKANGAKSTDVTQHETMPPQILKLSDAFKGFYETPPLELNVKVITEAEEKSTLGGYFDFIKFIKQHAKNSRIKKEYVADYIKKYKGSKIFKVFLQNLGEEEVADMASIEYNEEEEKRVIAEEAREEGREEGERKGREEGREEGERKGREEAMIKIAKNLISLSYSTAEIVQITSLTEGQVDMLR